MITFQVQKMLRKISRLRLLNEILHELTCILIEIAIKQNFLKNLF